MKTYLKRGIDFIFGENEDDVSIAVLVRPDGTWLEVDGSQVKIDDGSGDGIKAVQDLLFWADAQGPGGAA